MKHVYLHLEQEVRSDYMVSLKKHVETHSNASCELVLRDVHLRSDHPGHVNVGLNTARETQKERELINRINTVGQSEVQEVQ